MKQLSKSEKETTQTHKRTNVFSQHHKNYATSLIMFASSFNAVRSSPSIISKNVSSKSSRSSSNRRSTVKVRAMRNDANKVLHHRKRAELDPASSTYNEQRAKQHMVAQAQATPGGGYVGGTHISAEPAAVAAAEARHKRLAPHADG